MPGWGRRLRIMIDWTFALLFRPDVVKVGLDSETAMLLRESVLADAVSTSGEQGGAKAHLSVVGCRPTSAARPETDNGHPYVQTNVSSTEDATARTAFPYRL
jgi:hypothetical protein